MGSTSEIGFRYSNEQFTCDDDNFDCLSNLLTLTEKKPLSDNLLNQDVDGKSNDVSLDFLLDTLCGVSNEKLLEKSSVSEINSGLKFPSLEELFNDQTRSSNDNNDAITRNKSNPDVHGFSLADLYCQGKSKTSEKDKSTLFDERSNSANNIRQGIESPSLTNVEKESNLFDFLLSDSKCAPPVKKYDDIDGQESDIYVCKRTSSSSSKNEEDLSLDDLCISTKSRSESFSDQSTISSEEIPSFADEQLQQKTTQSDSSSESGYLSEKEKETVSLVNLTLAKNSILEKTNVHSKSGNSRAVLVKSGPDFRKKNALLKSKPSLFCKVLSSKVKTCNVSSVPQLPSDLPELLNRIDYWKYFSFDTPSPDDLVKEKQKNSFQS